MLGKTIPSAIALTVVVAVGCAFRPAKPVAEQPYVAIDGMRASAFIHASRRSIKLTLANPSPPKEKLMVCTYYFSIRVSVKRASGKLEKADFGADKVPAPNDSDWMIIPSDYTVSTMIKLPDEWGPIGSGDKVDLDWDSTKVLRPKYMQKNFPYDSVKVIDHILVNDIGLEDR